MKNKYILGVTGFTNYHDNSACLIKNGKVVFASSEERFSRIKHDPSFPAKTIKAALKYQKISMKEVVFVVSGWSMRSPTKVFIKQHLLIDIFRSLSYLGISANFELLPLLLKLAKREKVASETNLSLSARDKKENFLYIDHHQAHASSAYRASGFRECLAVTLDGFGSTMDNDLRSGSVWICEGGVMREVESIPIEASLGLFYEAVTVALGFKPADGEGKTMGLAAYGDQKKLHRQMQSIIPRFKKGRWVKSPYWIDTLLSIELDYKPIFLKTRLGELLSRLISQNSRRDVAAAAQKVLEEESVEFFEYLAKKYKKSKFACAGGVFLNVKMNKKIEELPRVKEIFIYPNAGDGGVAIGAALEVYAQKFGAKKTLSKLESAALGPKYSNKRILKTIKKNKKVKYEKLKDPAKYAGKAIAKGKVIGWFQGRAEWGPRALGQRSVLADPRDEKVKERINSIMKRRDWFMPFAPSVMSEHADKWFKGSGDPYMTMACDVVKGKEKQISAAIHIDNTARPNMVNKKVNPKYWGVINAFYKITGVPIILNTSFNKHGLPIVDSPEDAIRHLLWGCVDELVIGNYLCKTRV